jgi:hypothetical protein
MPRTGLASVAARRQPVIKAATCLEDRNIPFVFSNAKS